MNSSRSYFRLLMASAGFTLVEVALAIGLFSFALVSIMGLLPVGMSSFRESKARMIEAAIAQQRTSEILQTPFHVLTQPGSALNTRVTGLQFYSEEGMKVGNVTDWPGFLTNLPASAFTNNAVYASVVRINPTLEFGTSSSSNVVRAVVEVTRLSSLGRSSKMPVYVPNVGK